MSPTRFPQVIQLGRQHESDLARLLLDLDAASRVSRFNCAAGDDYLLRHSQQAIVTATWLAGIFVDRRLRGLVEVYDVDCSGMVEAAFLVEKTSRCRGLGTALLKTAMQWAAENNRVLLRMVFSASNWPMRKLASIADARFDLYFDEMVADIAITSPLGNLRPVPVRSACAPV